MADLQLSVSRVQEKGPEKIDTAHIKNMMNVKGR